MRPLIGFLLAGAALNAAEPLSTVERNRLMSHLEMTESWIVDEVSRLTPAQREFRPSPEAWSIKEVVEHLAIAEPQYWAQFEKAKSAEKLDRKPKLTDAELHWYGIDRSDRQKTGEARVPKGQYKDLDSALSSFRKLRATIKDYTRNSTDELRGLTYKNTEMDGYNWILMISTHSQRHILQIREIKANAKFPG